MDNLEGGPYPFLPLSAGESRCPLVTKGVGYSLQLTDLHQPGKHFKWGRSLKSNRLLGPKISLLVKAKT